MAAVKGILTPLIKSDCNRLENYKKHGGYKIARKALRQKPEEILDELKKSNLRGLGGAGFPAGIKWGFIPKGGEKPVYLVVNCDESEPGTFKDKYIVSHATHAMLEGIIVASHCINAHTCYIYIRGEYIEQAQIIEDSIQEAYDAKILGKNILGSSFNLDVYVHRGAGAYICGEETALLNSLEGRKGWPRMKPPFPAIEGFNSCPTIVNNVETLSYVPSILQNGGEWFANFGHGRSGGMRIFGISGHVKKPGIYELPVGTPLREIIYEHAGGILNDKKLKCVVPGGASSPPLRAEDIDIPMETDELAKAGSMLGSGAIMVMDEDTSLLEMLMVTLRFFHHESCGQCTPCREGTGWLDKILKRIHSGVTWESDLDSLDAIANGISGNTICALGDAAAMPVMGYIKKFPNELKAELEAKRAAMVGASKMVKAS